LHSQHTEISGYFQVKGKQKVNIRYRSGTHEWGAFEGKEIANKPADCLPSAKTNAMKPAN
jgi:hypothetical protein